MTVGPCHSNPCGYLRAGSVCTFCRGWDLSLHAGDDPEASFDVDPFKLTNYDRTYAELESMLLFSLLVAGKRADFARTKTAGLLRSLPGDGECAFRRLRAALGSGELAARLRRARTGQYAKLVAAISHLCGQLSGEHFALDLRRCSLGELMSVPGVGPKTARMFLLHSRGGARVAVLDTHILKWMTRFPEEWLRERGIWRVPEVTPPPGRLYDALEGFFLANADVLGKTPAELDLEIWKASTVSKGMK